MKDLVGKAYEMPSEYGTLAIGKQQISSKNVNAVEHEVNVIEHDIVTTCGIDDLVVHEEIRRSGSVWIVAAIAWLIGMTCGCLSACVCVKRMAKQTYKEDDDRADMVEIQRKLTVANVKDLCRERQLPVTGLKFDLAKRLLTAFPLRELLTTDKEKRELSTLVSKGDWIDPKAWFSRMEANKYLKHE